MTAHMQAPTGQDAEVLAALAGLAEPDSRADPYPLYDRLRALGCAVVAPGGTLVCHRLPGLLGAAARPPAV